MNTQFPPLERTPRSAARRAQQGIAPQEAQAQGEGMPAARLLPRAEEPGDADFSPANAWEDSSTSYTEPETEEQVHIEGRPMARRPSPRMGGSEYADHSSAEDWEDTGRSYAAPGTGAQAHLGDMPNAPIYKYASSTPARPSPRMEESEFTDHTSAEPWEESGTAYTASGRETQAHIGGRPAVPRPSPRVGGPEFTDFPPEGSWEDTSTIYTVSESHSFFSRQSPLFWIVAAVLLISMLAVAGSVMIGKWRELEAEREQARIEQQLADEKAQYKLSYRELIEQNAYEFGIEPAVIAAVIYNESRFRPEAESYLGARGLMQIMLDTWDWIAGKLETGSGHSFDDMFIPEKNIRYGTWYLAFLCEMFDGDLIKIAAGYHAGQHAVESWLANPDYSSDGKTLEYIPASYKDTDQYVGRVVTAYEMYRKHYFAPQEEAIEPAS